MVEIISPPVFDVFCEVEQLRARRNSLLANKSSVDVQRRIVRAISAAAFTWLNSRTTPHESKSSYETAMVWYSLEPFLESLNEKSCWSLINQEEVLGSVAPAVIGHIIASNTPLLATTSVVRALLITSASYVKLPLQYEDPWLSIFLTHLESADSDIAALVTFRSWSRTDISLNETLFTTADRLVVYGSDETVQAIRQSAKIPILSYGHKVSAGIITQLGLNDNIWDKLATDVLMYDQTGCLSPHTFFVQGTENEGVTVAANLAHALKNTRFKAIANSAERAAKIGEYRSLMRMDPDVIYCESVDERYTVGLNRRHALHVSPGHAIVYVVPATKEGIIQLLTQAKSLIQGIVLASGSTMETAGWQSALSEAGFNHVCRPGTIQQPTIHWREDGLDVLRSLLV